MPRIPVDQPYTITTQFGVPDSNALFGKHSGLDLAVPLNRPIYAPASGQLTNIVSKTGGNMVQIYDGKYWHRLMHNNSFSRSNGSVQEGEEVARAGTTGLSFGVHSHWDVATQQTPTNFSAFIDPNVYLKEGANMPSYQVIDTARINAYGTLGRNGIIVNGDNVSYVDSQNALGGGVDADLVKNHVGQEITADIRNMYSSPEGQSAINKTNQLYALAVQVAPLKATNTNLATKNKELQDKLSAIDNGDAIIITRKGFNALFDFLKQWFAKNN